MINGSGSGTSVTMDVFTEVPLLHLPFIFSSTGQLPRVHFHHPGQVLMSLGWHFHTVWECADRHKMLVEQLGQPVDRAPLRELQLIATDPACT
jgi:hypothetical protein